MRARVFPTSLYLPFLDLPRIFFSALARSLPPSPLSPFSFFSPPSFAESPRCVCPSARVRRSFLCPNFNSLSLSLSPPRSSSISRFFDSKERAKKQRHMHQRRAGERAPLCKVKIFPSQTWKDTAFLREWTDYDMLHEESKFGPS